MTLALFLKFLHIMASFWLITGILGRHVALSKAEQSKDIRTTCTLLPVASVFENGMVRPSSTAVLLAGLATAWAQGWPILGFLQGGASNWLLVSLLLTLSFIPVVALVFIPRGKIFEQRLNEAIAKDQVTPELTAAFNDPAVQAARRYEIAALVVIIFLMVVKPF